MIRKIWSRILNTLPKGKMGKTLIYALVLFLVSFVLIFMAVKMAKAESMIVNMTSQITGSQGIMSAGTSYSSTTNNGFLSQNRYEFEAREVGGECSINHTFGVAPSSDIETGLEMQMNGIPQPGVPVFLAAEEKIGAGILRTGGENQVEKFTGAIGSAVMVSQVSHTSESRTNAGEITHSVMSEGQGLIKTGMIGHYYLYQGPEPEENGESMHPQICPWGQGVELAELANQSYDFHYRYQGGEYSYQFIGVIGPPEAF